MPQAGDGGVANFTQRRMEEVQAAVLHPFPIGLMMGDAQQRVDDRRGISRGKCLLSLFLRNRQDRFVFHSILPCGFVNPALAKASFICGVSWSQWRTCP